MMFNKNLSVFGLASALMFSATAAFADGSQEVAQQQKSLLEKLDSLNAAVLGLRLNGTVKAGALASMSASDQYSDISPTQENQAYSDANLVFTARPSSETKIHVELRLHKDWQNAYDENNNPVIGHWFSYDGNILNHHVDFNLGYMRVGYTPYTLYTPQQLLLQEPEIFAQKRVEALAQRNLDTTTTRLMQGVNADYHSREIGPVDDIHAQVTGARMRNTAKKYDQVFFDFDYADRYFYGLRLGADAFGAHLGVNYTDVFDRQLSTRSRLQDGDTVTYEDNSILSIEASFNSKKLLPSLPVTFGLNGEFAMSSWTAENDFLVKGFETKYSLVETKVNGETLAYVKSSTTPVLSNKSEELADASGNAFYGQLYANLDLASIKGDLKVSYMMNDEDFWSEMASSPVYRGATTVLNANALFGNDVYTGLVNQFGMSSLENMYFSVYNSNPLNATNLMSSETSHNALSSQGEDGRYLYSRLYNNYKNAHFYRNGYKADVLKRLEIGQALFNMDPGSSMELPYGMATPDRKGLQLALDLKWNDAVEFNAIFSMLNEGAALNLETLTLEENNYTRYAVGLGADIGRLLNMGRKIKLQGSYDHTEEDSFLKRSNDRIMAGLEADVYGPVALLAGYQMSTREFGNAMTVNEFAAINKAEESLLLVGPRVKLAANSFLSVQYGMLTDKVSFLNFATGAADELSIDKNVIIADVTVNF